MLKNNDIIISNLHFKYEKNSQMELHLSKYEDPTLYTLISEKQVFNSGFNIQVQILKEIYTGIEVKRTLKTPWGNLNATQIKAIQAREKWNKFGLGKEDLKKLADRKPYKIAPDTFMEYNMSFLDNTHNKSVIKKLMIDPYNIEKIKIREDRLHTTNDLDKFVYDIYKTIDNETDNENNENDDIAYKNDDIAYKNYKYMTRDYENVRDDIILKPKKKQGQRKAFRPQRNGGSFVPSFRRGECNNDNNNNNNNDNTTTNDRSFVPRHKRDRDSRDGRGW